MFGDNNFIGVFTMLKKLLSLLLISCLLCGMGSALAETGDIYSQIDTAITATGNYMLGNPEYNGDWVILGLARGSINVPNVYYEGYYSDISNNLNSLTSATDYSRVILALTSIGKDPTNVNSQNLIDNLGEFQISNLSTAIYTLIALDSNNYRFSDDDLNMMREPIISYIIYSQLSDNNGELTGWPGWDGYLELDTTAMVLQALAPYKNRPDVQYAIDKAVSWISTQQMPDGGFLFYGSASCESASQVLIALSALGIDAATDVRFIKNGKTMLDFIMSFYNQNGYFMILNEFNNWVENDYRTKQAMYSLVSYRRFRLGINSLFNMTDEPSINIKSNLLNNVDFTVNTPKNKLFILGAYKNGILVKTKLITSVITQGTFQIDYSDLASEDCDTISALVWENLSSLKPLCAKFSLK